MKYPFGVCCAPNQLLTAAEAGFDYAELNLTQLHNMSDDEYSSVLAAAKASPIPVLCCNCLLPGSVRVTGAQADLDTARAFLALAFDRARRLGVRRVVFGAGDARRVLPGESAPRAWRQLADFLRMASPLAAQNDLTLCVEPLGKGECNLLNYVSEAVALVSLLELPSLAVLGDTYHMAHNGDDLAALPMAGPLLKHMHVSVPENGRRLPPARRHQKLLAALRAALETAGYQGCVSVEAQITDLLREGTEACEAFREA